MKTIKDVLDEYKWLDFNEAFTANELEHIYYVMAEYGRQLQPESPVEAAAKELAIDFAWENSSLDIKQGYQSFRKRFDEWIAENKYHRKPNPGEQGQEDAWREVIKKIEEEQFLETKYNDVITRLSNLYHLIKKQP